MDESSLTAERIERAALADLHAAASPEISEALGLRTEEVAGALVSIVGGDKSIVVNRTVGLGVEQPATREAVSRVIDLYGEAGVQRFYVHVHPEAQPAELREWLLEAGLKKGRGWMKFHRGTEPAPEGTSPLDVRPIGPEHAADFGRILVPCFDLAEGSAALLASLVGREGWRCFMSFAGDEPAGTGALYIRDRIAWFDWGATHTDHRRKGGQNAALRARVREALSLGCRRMLTETGESVDGDPQHSYKNILKAGFQTDRVRENYVPDV